MTQVETFLPKQELEAEFPDGSDPSKHYFLPGSELPRGSEHQFQLIAEMNKGNKFKS